ncbi:MAG: hypothetical protein ABI091_25780 [Ferruginibacter sp.]
MERLTVNNSTRHLLNSIQTRNQIEQIKNLERFKEKGIVQFKELLSIPFDDRLPRLVEKYGKEKIHGLLIILLTEFANSFNLIRPMTPDQIVSCAFEMIDISHEDYLSIEDFTLFFQGAKSAKYGRVLDRLDQQTVFELFENYRQQRHLEYVRIKQEKESQFKVSGLSKRDAVDSTDLKTLMHEANLEYFKSKNK